MKYLSLLVWVTQFGFSVLFPVCFFLMIAFWLQQKFALGIWIVAVLGVLGLLTSFSTATHEPMAALIRIFPRSKVPMSNWLARNSPATSSTSHTSVPTATRLTSFREAG